MAELIYKLSDGDNVLTWYSLTSAAEGVHAYAQEHPERIDFFKLSTYISTRNGAKLAAAYEGEDIIAFFNDAVIIEDEEYE